MTRDDCFYIWDIVEDAIIHPEKYSRRERQQHKAWNDLFIGNKHVLTIWQSRRIQTITLLDNICIDCVAADFTIHSSTIFGTLLDIDSKDDIDSLALQYNLLYDTDLIYNLVLSSYVYKLMKKYDHSSVSVFTKDIITLRDKI